METSYLNLDKILNIKKWQTLQDSIALVTKTAIITVDYKGNPLTMHSYPCKFCQFVRGQLELQKFCFKCDSRGGLEAVRQNAPYIYLCHCNIVDIAIPIIIDGKYIGAIMAGEIRLPEDEEDSLEKILLSPAKKVFETEGAIRMYNEIPTASYVEVQRTADMLFEIANYIVEEAVNKNLILKMYGDITNLDNVKSNSNIASGYPPDNIRHVKKAINSAIASAYVRTSDEENAICKNPVLRPAFSYIYGHKGENITQKQMADLCHISTSHFSRLFIKEVGEGFSNFLSRLKIQWSKKLLEKTDLPIAQISDEMGFSDSSYYIKTFKKYENVTPAVYRKYYFDTNLG